jgi:putative nucleotidyltransferase with HDIG domain
MEQEARLKAKFILWSVLVFIASAICTMNLASAAIIVGLCAYLQIKRQFIKPNTYLNLLLLLVMIFTAAYYIVNNKIPVFIIPFSLVPMLTTLLFADLEISLLMTIACSVSVASISNSFFAISALFLISGLLSSLLVQGARKRTTVIKSGFIIGIAQVATLLFLERFWFGEPVRYLILFLNGVLTSIIALGVLPIFEHLFKTVTNISLLELADSHQPLLQRMILEAPGTYHHSLIVGNLSDAACKAVSANGLLARVGAYYHDIGKIEKAEYFSENQIISQNKHDMLSADMSKLIIMNHVREGVELGKKYRINPTLIEFIQQHHGNSLVYYFYRRAIETLEDDNSIKEEGFRYPGPKPATKEAAIVLLADSVEAATRALKDPTPIKIEEVVHKVINNKFIDGQLDECDLKLKDIEKIAAVFIRILGGIYHSRVPYGDEPKTEHSNKKPAKETTHQSDKDKKRSS